MPLAVIVGLLIKRKYPGPLFFKQLREGKNGKTFYIWKLRTMVTNANEVLKKIIAEDEAMAKEWNEFACFKNDPRIAGSIGKMARKLSIDELPQLINIFKGDMVFVGPRPLEMYLAEALPATERDCRNTVKPGLTGLWQIGPRSDISIRHMQYYDRLYIRKKSICLNIYILLKTVTVVFRQTGV
ncbi:MAG: sugar transferase [Mucilaginibacter sp.]|nr:sugar transferase [Mucilaginibacter sp.]